MDCFRQLIDFELDGVEWSELNLGAFARLKIFFQHFSKLANLFVQSAKNFKITETIVVVSKSYRHSEVKERLAQKSKQRKERK